MKAKVSVYSGICGYTTLIEANAHDEKGSCEVYIKCTCPALKKFMDEPLELNLKDENSWERSLVHARFRELCPHTNCLVPSGIIRAVQVASGMKKSEDAYIHFIEPEGQYCKGDFPSQPV
jgi:hypothetical protein